MNIIHLIFSFNLGGAELMLIDIINKQVRTNDVSLIIVNNNYSSKLLEEIDKSVDIHLINRKEGSRNPFPILKLNYLLFRSKIDILHCHDERIIKLVLSAKLKSKSILSIHDTGIISDAFTKYKLLFSISNAVKEDVKNRYGLASILIYNGINSSSIRKKEHVNSSVVGQDKIHLLQVSRLDHHKKGQDILIKSIYEVINRTKNKNLVLDFIGDGASIEYLTELTEKLNIQDNIRFLGLKDRKYVYSHLADYDLLIQPSIYEGFGLTIVEAMFAKIPVMVSDIEGPMEIINKGEFGLFFEKGNVADLTNKLELFLMNKEDRKDPDVVYDYAKSKFSIENTVDHYMKYYKKI